MYQAAEVTDELTASAVIFAAPGLLTAVNIITDGTNPATVIIHDNASAGSGKKIYEGTAAGANHYGGRNFVFPLRCYNGIYMTISGTGASAIIEYINKAG